MSHKYKGLLARGLTKQKGIAIVTVLAVITIVSILVTVVLYFVFRGTEISGLQKRYETAREASYGAIDVVINEIIPKAISGTSLSNIISDFQNTTARVTAGTADTCFNSKLLSSTEDWEGCNSDSDIKKSFDIRFRLSGQASGVAYDVYTKIVDTVRGNTDTSGVSLEGGGVAEQTSGIVTVQHLPYMYKIDVQGENAVSPNERANIEVLYAY